MEERPGLLDVNVLVALFDPDHVHHELAHDWFADHRRCGWATCPTTEGGFLRVLSNPAYGASVHRVSDLAGRLRVLCDSAEHRFWTASASLLDPLRFDLALVAGYRQLTDIYLLGVATHHGGRLVTFDRTIPIRAVRGADEGALAVVAPAPS